MQMSKYWRNKRLRYLLVRDSRNGWNERAAAEPRKRVARRLERESVERKLEKVAS